MNKLSITFLFMFLISGYTMCEVKSSVNDKSAAFEKLLHSVQSEAGNYDVNPGLTDFKRKAQAGLDYKYPGSNFINLRCEKVIDWSQSSFESLYSYLTAMYSDDSDLRNPEWIEDVLLEFDKKKCQIGIINWNILIDGKLNALISIAVFDDKWNVLYDTELVNFIVNSEEHSERLESENNSTDEISAIKNQDSQTKYRLIYLPNLFGHVYLYYEARVTAVVSPYITASTNDASYRLYTEHIICERRNPGGIPPEATPVLYFGTDGSHLHSIPYKSPITVTGGSGDRFNSGLYNVSGFNGLNWSFSFDFSVDFPGGGIGITPQQNFSELSLEAISNSSVNLLNYVYRPLNTIFYRAVFYNGGSLNADDFKIFTGTGAGEIGRVDITSKLQVAFISYVAGELFEMAETSTGFDFPVKFLRGDHVLQPAYQLTSTRYNIAVGQIDTLKAKIINNSHAVKLIGGNISVDISSLYNILTVLSSATLPIGSIDTAASKEFRFVVRGNTNGIVTPQINISAMGWESPVPPTILINNITSIDSNIDVSPLIKTLTLTAPIQGFYNAATNSMIQDTLRVCLRNAASPYNIADSAKAFLNTSGGGEFLFSNAVNFTQYYIQTNHRNSIETWSKTTPIFINSALSYDFSTSNTQAYGDNMIQVDSSPLRFAIYGGDVNQDGIVDGNDGVLIDNDAAAFNTGYLPTDLNGDETIDGGDAVIADNSSANFVIAVTP